MTVRALAIVCAAVALLAPLGAGAQPRGDSLGAGWRPGNSSDYCAVLGNFAASFTLRLGDNPQPATSAILTDIQTRWTRLPLKLQ